MKQKTIKNPVTLSGIGVHTGSKSTMTFLPEEPGKGIYFVRVDLPDNPVIPANISHVINTARGTILGNGDAKAYTVEHVMAALWANGITNLRIEMDAPEPPVGDGSALPFINMIKKAGIVEQSPETSPLIVDKFITLNSGDHFLAAVPYDGFKITYTLAYDHPLIPTQYLVMEFNDETFEKEIAPCRTFCFYHEVEALMDKGLIQGGSLDNAVVIGEEAILSKEGLRFEDEFARHKILDLIGDLYLTGRMIKGHFIGVKSGHSLNVQMAKAISGNAKMSESLNQTSVDGVGKECNVLDYEEIKRILPHRYPFLLIDRIISMTDDGAVGIKNVTGNEDYFNGHFPEQAMMPGVLQIEAMAQVVGVSFLSNRAVQSQRAVLVAVDRAKFRKPVVPGDQLIIEISNQKFKGRIGKAFGQIKIKEEVVSEAELTFALMEIKS